MMSVLTMTSLGSTSIDELPRSGGVKAPKGETINTDEFLAELKDASSAGLTSLPTRDIPSEPEQPTDPLVVQNVVPKPSRTNYIEEEANADTIIENKKSKEESASFYNDLITQNYIPILASLLFFLTQLPTTRAFIAKNLPFCYLADGETTLQGMILMSAIFGMTLVAVDYALENLI